MPRQIIIPFSVVVILIILILVIAPGSLRADTQGANNPGTMVNDAGTGSTAWTSPGNVASSNNVWASVALSNGGASNYIKATNFGFSIPTGSTINGIVAEMERSEANANGNNFCQDNAVRIVKGGTIGSTDRSNSGVDWPTTEAYFSYGSSSDPWGETWTVSDINASNFGFAISAVNRRSSGNPSNTETCRVDHIRITVHYTLPPTTYDQSAYRWFNNNNGTNVGSALANQDTLATAPVKDTPFRLRMMLHIGATSLAQNGQNFKLQFAKKGSGSCASPEFSYADVTGSSAIQYYDNASASDGAALTTNANDPQHSTHTTRGQTYEEANNFTNSQSSVAIGEDGLWDFALVDATADYGENYCFKTVLSSGSNIDSYGIYPEITTAAAPTIDQSAYRWFENADSTNVGSALANQDTSATLTSTGQAFRLRANLHANTNKLNPSSQDFKLQIAQKGTGTCASPEFSYSDVSDPPSSSEGPLGPATATTDSSIGDVDWLNPSNVTAEDGSYAGNEGGTANTFYLKATNFGFSIPDGATITGIEVDVKKYYTGINPANDNAVRIVKGGNIGSTDRSIGGSWPSSLSYVSYGSDSDLWGETWSASDINSSDFGFAISAFVPLSVSIDYIRITVHYSGSGGSSIRYNDNSTSSDGTILTDNANDPVHSGHTNSNQTYEEANNFTNSESTIAAGEDGLWDFALIDDGSPGDTTYCFRVVDSSGSTLSSYSVYPEITTYNPGGTGTSADIVDAAGDPVADPAFSLNGHTLSFDCESVSGTFASSSQRVRVSNGFTAEDWSLTLAATDGATASWSGGPVDYDFNDNTGSPTGCSDGGDSDSLAGQITFDPSAGTLTPEGGCSTTGITKGSSSSFIEGTTDNLTILSGTTASDTDCYWDLTGIDVSQQIPASQPTGTYNINLTLTLTVF